MEFERIARAANGLKTSAPVNYLALIASVWILALVGGRGAVSPVAVLVEVLCAAAFLAALFATRSPDERQTPLRLHWATAFVLGAASVLFGARGWFDGVPAFHHDWKWPLDALQSHDQLNGLGSLWLLWGSGAPAVQALGNYPITVAGWLLGFMLPTNVALLAVLALIGGCAASGIASLASATGLSRPYQIALSLCIAAMPAWFNRIDAGHLEWLFGYALFPWAMAIAISDTRRRKLGGALGGLWGLAGGQAQFLLFFPLAAAPFVLRGRRWIAAIVAFLLAIVLQLPAITAMAFAQRLDAFSGQRTNLTWQSAQSDPLSLALVSGADPAHYFLHWQNGAGFTLAFVALALAAIGAAARPVTQSLGALWLLTACWSSGLDGPFAAPASWLFTHVPDAIALREFAHAQALTATFFLVLAAHGTQTAITKLRQRPNAGAALLFAALLPLTLAWYSGASTRIAPGVPASLARDAIAGDIERLPGSGQVLWWPGLDAVAWRRPPTQGGVDSEAFVTGRHAPYIEYRPTAALARAVTASAAGDRASCGLLGDLGVQAVVIRTNIRSAAGSAFASIQVPSAATMRSDGLIERASEGPYRLYAVPCYRGRFTIAIDALLQGDWSLIEHVSAKLGSTDEQTQPPPAPHGCRVAPFLVAPNRTTDVATDWVPLSEADDELLAFDGAFGNVLVTNNPAHTVHQWVLGAARNGRFTWMSPERFNALLPGTVGVWEAAACPHAVRRAVGRVEASRALPFAGGTLVLQKPMLVVSHYSSYAGWTLWANGNPARKPMLADGYATGWLLHPGLWRLALVPDGPPIALLWAIAGLAGACCLLLVVIPKRT